MKIALPIAIVLHAFLFFWNVGGETWSFVGGSHGEPSARPIVVSAAQPTTKAPPLKGEGVPVAAQGRLGQGATFRQSELVGWGNPIPAYPSWERENDIEGIVEVELVFDEREVKSVNLKGSSGSRALDRSVIETVKSWRVPEGVSVRKSWKVPVSFEFRAAN